MCRTRRPLGTSTVVRYTPSPSSTSHGDAPDAVVSGSATQVLPSGSIPRSMNEGRESGMGASENARRTSGRRASR